MTKLNLTGKMNALQSLSCSFTSVQMLNLFPSASLLLLLGVVLGHVSASPASVGLVFRHDLLSSVTSAITARIEATVQARMSISVNLFSSPLFSSLPLCNKSQMS
jgi:hypothetical protein